jgi:hypothetical protein
VQTKSVIQIRSHAQKYFIKMQKEGRPNAIPPKRRKRDPANPNQPPPSRESKAEKKERAAGGKVDEADHAHAQTLAELFAGLHGAEDEGDSMDEGDDSQLSDASSSPSSSPQSSERSLRDLSVKAEQGVDEDGDLVRRGKRARGSKGATGASKRRKVVQSSSYRVGQPLQTNEGPAVVHAVRDDGDYDVILAGETEPTPYKSTDMWLEEEEQGAAILAGEQKKAGSGKGVKDEEATAMENASLLRSLSPFIYLAALSQGEGNEKDEKLDQAPPAAGKRKKMAAQSS